MVLLATTALPATRVGAGEETPPASCPGYIAHLRLARSYLAKGNRAAAADELERAEAALQACTRGDARSNAVG